MTMPDLSTGLLSQHDEQHQTPLWKAFKRFKSTLDEKDKADFTDVSLEDLLCQVRDLDQQHAVSSTTRSISRHFEPLIYFLDRHAKAIDCMVQCYPNPSALIWGMLRVILDVRHSTCTATVSSILTCQGCWGIHPIFREVSCHG